MIVRSLFDKIASPRLHAMMVWEGILGGDRSALMPSESDPRIGRVWDGEAATGKAVASVLLKGIPNPKPELLHHPAWDIYLVYPPGVRWAGAAPPPPAAWMHQLGPLMTVTPERRLDGDKLYRIVSDLVPR
ncbi:MAG TPA: hypothetical protein VGO93_10805 [Candidatus Xenobia bacterium]